MKKKILKLIEDENYVKYINNKKAVDHVNCVFSKLPRLMMPIN